MCRCLCALFVVASTAGIANTAHARPATSHVRCMDKSACRILENGLSQSPTVNRLAANIERSDVLVFVVAKLTDTMPVSKTQFISAAPGARYVIVTIDPRAPKIELIGRLAHELQHVSEIADAPEVKDAEGLRALLTKIGWPTHRGNWETSTAIDTGRQATSEAAGWRSHVTSLARDGAGHRAAPAEDR